LNTLPLSDPPKTVRELRDKIKENEILRDVLERLKEDSAVLQASLEKKRAKLGDASIQGNIGLRRKEIEAIEKRLDEVEKQIAKTKQDVKEKANASAEVLHMDKQLNLMEN